jgi:hypothetical protein
MVIKKHCVDSEHVIVVALRGLEQGLSAEYVLVAVQL